MPVIVAVVAICLLVGALSGAYGVGAAIFCWLGLIALAAWVVYVVRHPVPSTTPTRAVGPPTHSDGIPLRDGRPYGPLWRARMAQVAERDNWTCQNRRCGRRVYRHYENRRDSIHIDHIRPLTRGGHPTAMSNLQVLCRDCNLRKGGR